MVCAQVIECTGKAIAVQQQNNTRGLTLASASLTTVSQESIKNMPSLRTADPVLRLESELLSQAYTFRGQALLASASPGGSTGVTRRALEAFLESAR